MLKTEELERYKRQIMIPGLGEEGQEKIKKAKIFVGGVGGLGSPAIYYLTAAGVGQLRIVDSDAVELSNLNRQILHWTSDVGKHKVDSARGKLQDLNPAVKVEAIRERITPENVKDLIQGYDVIVDALDNLQTRYLLNQTAQELKLPFCHGAVYGLEGRAMTIVPGLSACLMCIYHGATVNQKIPVLGATPGVIACIQATEAIKYITGIGQLLTNRLLIYDGLNMCFSEIRVNPDPACKHCGH
jgi:molybdopterin-synthase adenylyltransferase